MREKRQYHRLTVKAHGPLASDIDSVTLDGKELRGVTDVRVSLNVESLSEATISLYIEPDIDVPADIHLQAVRDDGILRRLWCWLRYWRARKVAA